MRWLFSFLLLGFLGLVQALSSSGNRLLVVLEDLTEREKYSKFFGDLEGKWRFGWIYETGFHFCSGQLISIT